MTPDPARAGSLSAGTPAARLAVAATVLGSGVVFVEGTVVNVALPHMARDLGLGVAGVQWVLNGYLLTLGALILLGGSLGDRYGTRRVFVVGLLGFAATSLLCALAPDAVFLVAFRAIQGAAGALLVPNSLALLTVAFAPEDRGAAIGRWSAWSAVSTAAGPLVGGWLVDAGSWRWVFGIIVPFALAAAWIAHGRLEGVGEARDTGAVRPSLDWAGAAAGTLGLGLAVGALISGPELGFGSTPVVAGLAGGGIVLLALPAIERRAEAPLVPADLFRDRQFAGGNLVTLLVYAALSAIFFLVVVQLQNTLGYSALAAGAALLPVNVLMLLLSPAAGRLGGRVGPAPPVAAGALVAGCGALWLAELEGGDPYLSSVLPSVALFGLGLAVLVAPLTDAVLSSADPGRAGTASGVNNAVARLAGLVGTAVLPLVAGLGGLDALTGPAFVEGYRGALRWAAALCGTGGVVAALTLRSWVTLRSILHPSPTHGCVERPPG